MFFAEKKGPRLALFGVGLLCMLLAGLGTPLPIWDQWLFDHNLKWQRQRLPPVSSRIALVGLRPQDYQRWPGTAEEYNGIAEVIEKVRAQGAAVIVLDLLLTRGRDSDFEAFWKAAWNRPDVILARGLEHQTRLPQPAPHQEALAHLQRDSDGLFRCYPLFALGDSQEEWPSLALASYRLLQAGDTRSQAADGPLRSLGSPLYFQPRAAWSEESDRNFQHLTLNQLGQWEKTGQKYRLEGKVVFLANVHGDIGSTVLDASVPKVQIHALALNSLIQQHAYLPLPWTLRSAVAGLSFLLGAWLAAGRGARHSRGLFWFTVLLLVAGGALVSQFWLLGRWLLPGFSWCLALLAGVVAVSTAQQLRWRSKITELKARWDGEDPRLFKILGSYLLVEKLGQGGFGAVYRGIPSDTLDDSQSVAIKLADPELSGNQEFRRRFLREARISRSLRHPAIVRVLESGQQDDLLYYTMEWLQGKSLKHWLEERAGLACSPQEVLEILKPVMEGMACAHSQNVLHRDLKPDNIVLEKQGPKIVDFGLAHDQESSQLTSAYDIMGTLQYLAPERLQGQAYDARSDQYALGVIGYEMLTGTSPFPQGQTTQEAILWRLTQQPRALSEVLGRSDGLTEVLQRMLAQEPDDRFPSLEEALQSLSRVAIKP